LTSEGVRLAILAADAELTALRARIEVLEKVADAAGVLVERIEKGDFREDDGRNFKGNPFVIDMRAAIDAAKEG
jgi:hypothetical protein